MPPWRLWPRCSAPWRRPLPRRTCCRSGCRRYSGQAGRWRRPWTAPRCHGGYGSRPPPAASADPQVSILGLLEQPLSFGSASVFALDSTWVPGTALPQQRQQLALDRELAESDAVHCCLCAGRAACCGGAAASSPRLLFSLSEHHHGPGAAAPSLRPLHGSIA